MRVLGLLSLFALWDWLRWILMRLSHLLTRIILLGEGHIDELEVAFVATTVRGLLLERLMPLCCDQILILFRPGR